MLMQALSALQERLELDAPGRSDAYKEYGLSWMIDLDDEKHIPIPMKDEKGRGKSSWAPYLRRSGGDIKPQLVVDKGDFVLGVPGEKPERSQKRHLEYVAVVNACAAHSGDEALIVLSRFLNSFTYDAEKYSDVGEGEFIAFRWKGELVHDRQSVQLLWEALVPKVSERGVGRLTEEKVLGWLGAGEAEPQDQNLSQCLVCGERTRPVRKVPLAVKLPRSVSDQQCALVAANKEAFWSYGMTQAHVAPLCFRDALATARALNHLISHEGSHVVLGSAAYVFWTKEAEAFSPASLLSNPEPQEVNQLLASAKRGTPASVDEGPFYAAAISASGPRLVIRDWLETTIGHAKSNLARWFRLQNIMDEQTGEMARPLPLKGFLTKEKRWVEGLAEQLCPKANGRRDLAKLSPEIPKLLLHVALHGGPLPHSILFEAVKRNRAEQGLTRPRAALIKIVTLSQMDSFEEGFMEMLDLNNRAPAYLCGRLLAELEALQVAALGKTNTTVTSRFYGTASSAPASVFGRLMRGAQAHFSKLRTTKAGTHEALQQRFEEIQLGLLRYPPILTLEEQGVFALGYYHQRAQDRADRKPYAEARKTEAAEKAE